MTDKIVTTFTGGPAGDWLTVFRIDRLLGGNAQTSIDIVRDFWTALANDMSSSLSILVHGDVEILDPITGLPTGVDSASSRTVSPSNGSDPLPWQTQGIILWNSGVWIGGRQVRGRTFVPGWTEQSNTNGLPTTGAMVALNAAANVIANATTGVPAIYSRKHNNTFPIASATVNQKWSVLRTRR